MKNFEVKKTSGFFKSFDGTMIHFEERGEGDAIVFVYGIACSTNHWHHQVDFLKKEFRVITFDLRGHHQSSTPELAENLSVEGCARDIVALLDHLNVPSAHLIGHSFGVPVSILTYSLVPARISSLVLVNGFIENPIKGMYGLDVVEKIYSFVKAYYVRDPAFWNKLWQLSTHNPITMVFAGLLGGFNLQVTQFKDIEIYAKGVSQIPLGNFLNLFQSLMDFHGESILETVLCKTLVIAGERDSITPLKLQVEIHEKIVRSQLCMIPYASHCTQLDFPDYVNLKIREHLK